MNVIELEKGFVLNDNHLIKEEAIEKGFKLAHEVEETDTYFTDKDKEFVRTRTCLRIRRIDSNYMELTYKAKSSQDTERYGKKEVNIQIKPTDYEDLVTVLSGLGYIKYVEFTKRCDLFSLQRCILNACEYFGGVADVILTDNMKTVILGRESGKPVWHPGFLDFANDIGFVPKVCKVRKPQTKGKVERLVHYVKDNFIPGRVFSDIHDLNRQAIIWCDKVNSKVSSSTGYTPIELLASEKLKELPDAMICERYKFESRLVSRDGFVSYDGVRYGVPWQYSGKQVTVRAVKNKLEIFDGIMLIANHDIEAHSGRTLFLEGQYRGLAEKNGLTFFSGAHMHSETVESRPLSIYEELLEVSNG